MAAGDLLSVECRWGNWKYRHFGVDLGDGMVMHLAGDRDRAGWMPSSWGKMSVRRESIEAFACGVPVKIEPKNRPLSVDEALRRAISWEGRAGYHLCERNCEHFARWCTTDDHSSFQMDRLRHGFRMAMQCSVKAAAAVSHRSPIVRKVLTTTAPGFSKVHRWTPAAWLSDLAEVGVVASGRRLGVSDETTEQIGKLTGVATAAAVGLIQGGPAGATIMVGSHLAAREVAGAISQSLEKAFSSATKVRTL